MLLQNKVDQIVNQILLSRMSSLIERALQSRRIIFQGAIIATLVALGVNLISESARVF